MSNARKLAAALLEKVANEGAYSNILLNNALKESSLSREDKALVTTVFYGTLDRTVMIDFYLKKLIKTPLKKLKPFTLAVLRSAVFQIKYLDKIPDSAVVNEAVEIIKHSNESFNATFVNGVLRSLIRSDIPLPVGRSIHDISVRCSTPAWIVTMLIEGYGADFTEEFLNESLKTPPTYIRVNTLKTRKSELLSSLLEKDVFAEDVEGEDALVIKGISVEALEEYKDGLFFVQDLSCQLAVKALSVDKDSRLLDLCAAPGGKSFSSAMYTTAGEILSFDLYESRVKLIKKGAERLGIKNLNASVGDATVFSDNIGRFDRIICDVPCSGIGVIRRKPDVKYKKQDDFEGLVKIQRDIMDNADKYLKEGGRLLYSTCTLNPKENGGNTEWFLREHPEYRLDFEKTFCPQSDGTDGFYAAVFAKQR